jgi:beta-xylosidase
LVLAITDHCIKLRRMSEPRDHRCFQATFDWDNGARDRFWLEVTNAAFDKGHLEQIAQALAYPSRSNAKPITQITKRDLQEIDCDRIPQSKMIQPIADAAFPDVRIIAREEGLRVS